LKAKAQIFDKFYKHGVQGDGISGPHLIYECLFLEYFQWVNTNSIASRYCAAYIKGNALMPKNDGDANEN
jgi:hypothetical protein